MLGYSQMMLSADPPESLKDGLEIVASEAQRAAKIIRNLQSFARRSGPEKKRGNVNTILERAIELKLHEFEQSNIEVSLSLSPEIPDSLLDEHQLVQVVINILPNAQQSMAAFQEGGNISVQSSLSGGKIQVRLSDNGPSIPPDILGKIFEPFFTTKDVGMGTGLSICHGLIQQHGGRLWAESTEGKGAISHIELPVWAGK